MYMPKMARINARGDGPTTGMAYSSTVIGTPPRRMAVPRSKSAISAQLGSSDRTISSWGSGMPTLCQLQSQTTMRARLSAARTPLAVHRTSSGL